jgi:hypothetical protein
VNSSRENILHQMGGNNLNNPAENGASLGWRNVVLGGAESDFLGQTHVVDQGDHTFTIPAFCLRCPDREAAGMRGRAAAQETWSKHITTNIEERSEKDGEDNDGRARFAAFGGLLWHLRRGAGSGGPSGRRGVSGRAYGQELQG